MRTCSSTKNARKIPGIFPDRGSLKAPKENGAKHAGLKYTNASTIQNDDNATAAAARRHNIAAPVLPSAKPISRPTYAMNERLANA